MRRWSLRLQRLARNVVGTARRAPTYTITKDEKMYYILITVHVLSCLFLLATILLQAGRGGGLTEAFSGQAQSVLGTQAPTVLKKATTLSAVLFLVLSLVLAVYKLFTLQHL